MDGFCWEDFNPEMLVDMVNGLVKMLGKSSKARNLSIGRFPDMVVEMGIFHGEL